MCIRALRILIVLATGLLCFGERASAQSCTITPANGAFGSIDVLPGTAIDSTSTITVSCTGNNNSTVRLCIEMGKGASAAGPSGERALTVSTEYLDFEFYSDSAHSQLWGSWGSVVTAYGTNGVSFDLALGPSGSASQNFTAYARILASQTTKIPQTYSWNGSSPAIRYGYVGGSACPTGGSTGTSSGSTWTATIPANANVSTTTLNFGSTSSLASNIDSTATISVQATNTTPYSIGLGIGSNASGSQRRVRLGATSNFINYNLYTDSGRSQALSTSTSTTSCTGGAGTCVLGTGSGASQNTTVYGRVPTQTIPAAGTFTDTVVVTVTF